jgi:hypothetical protein
MNTTNTPDIDLWRASRLAQELLGAELVPSDSHDEDGAMMTADQAWYFVPLADDPVMGRATISRPARSLGRPRWAVEVVQVCCGYPFEPDEYDLGEVGERSNSLFQAVEEASRIAHDQKIQGIAEGIWWEGENLREQLDPIPEYEGPTTCPHGKAWTDCDACDHASDLAYDAARESRHR